jgi:N-acetyl-alpha-D-muramate 1-phosphate uridylyltransferase
MSSDLPAVCILAGGLGSRLGPLVQNTPKPLLEVAGAPFVLYQLRMLAAQGVSRVVMCVGYLGDRIRATIGDDRFGVHIDYSHDAPGLSGTLGAIRRAAPLLGSRFLVLYGDTYLDLDVPKFVTDWTESGLLGGMTVLHNAGKWAPSNAVYKEGIVVAYDKKVAQPSMKWIDYGMNGLEALALGAVGSEETELSVLLSRLALDHQLFGFEVTTRFYEIGTPESLSETDAHLRSKGLGFQSI